MTSDTLEFIINIIYVNPVLSSLAATGIALLVRWLLSTIKYLYNLLTIRPFLNGMWITNFTSDANENKHNVEVYYFSRIANFKNNVEKYKFKFQQYNNLSSKPVIGWGEAIYSKNEIALYYSDIDSLGIGNMLLYIDQTYFGKYNKRLNGYYFELVNEKPVISNEVLRFDKMSFSIKDCLKIKLGFNMFKNHDVAMKKLQTLKLNDVDLDKIQIELTNKDRLCER